MSKRVKDERSIEIADWKAADSHIMKIGDDQAKINRMEAEAAKKVGMINEDLAKEVKPIKERIKLRLKSLEQFAELHKDDFGKIRSRKLAHGEIGWRRSSSTSITKKTLELIKRWLPKKLQDKCITVKESVNKPALSELTKKDLNRIEAKITPKDKFFVDPAKTKAVEY